MDDESHEAAKPFMSPKKFLAADNTDRSGLFTVLLEQLCDERGPAGLVACTDARAVISVKVFVEGDQVAPVRIGLKSRGAPKDRAASVSVKQKNSRKAL